MILSDRDIKSLINSGEIVIDPYDEDLVNPASLDVRLGDTFGVVSINTLKGYSAIDPLNPESFNTDYLQQTSWLLRPGDFVLGVLVEKIKLPAYISAELLGKSSLGRLGLSNSHVAGWIDAGFGLPTSLTIELSNESNVNSIKLSSGMKIGQIIFHNHRESEKPYAVKGRYLNQGVAEGSLGV